MKRITLSALLSLHILFCFCQEAVTIDIRHFKEENDSLKIGYRITTDWSALATHQGLSVVGIVSAGDSSLLLPRVLLAGNNKEKVITRYLKNSAKNVRSAALMAKAPQEFIFNIKVPYRMWMDSARISIRQEVLGYRGHTLISEFRLNERVELEIKEPYMVQPELAFITPKKEEKRRKRQGKAYLDFQAGRSVIIPTFRRNPEELQKIDDAVREVVSNKDAVLHGLYVEGYASPEGPFALNERLSRERATALKNYMRTKFSLSDELFRVNSVGEDWEGLEALVKASDLPEKDKVLETISTISIDGGRETALMKLNKGIPYRKMLKEMFPELRRVEYQIDYSVKDYGLEESKKLYQAKAEDLSQLELYTLALSYGKDSPEYKRILLEIIPQYYKDDETAAGNATAVLLTNGELGTASRYLDKSGDSTQAMNNKGVLYLLNGDLDKAEECFQKAKAGGLVEAVHNLNEVRTKREDNRKMERYSNRR